MASEPILTARFACPHCRQAGVFWNADAGRLPKVSNGFHLEDSRQGPNTLPAVICDRCDEIMDLRP
jgi:hypothetical protein